MDAAPNPAPGPAGLFPSDAAQRPPNPIFVCQGPLELSTMSLFMDFLRRSRGPSNQMSRAPWLTPGEYACFTLPYAQWATPAFCRGLLGDVSAETCVKLALCGMPDPQDIGAYPNGVPDMQDATPPYSGSDRLAFEHGVHLVKCRLWLGIPPVTERRWRDMELWKRENFDQALEVLAPVLEFTYWCCDINQFRMRRVHDRVLAALGRFDAAVHACKVLLGQCRPGDAVKPTAAANWCEFLFGHLRFAAGRAHEWVLKRVVELREPLLEELGRNASSGPGSLQRQALLLDQLYRLEDILLRCDFTLLVRLPGWDYSGLAHWRPATDAGHSPSWYLAHNPLDSLPGPYEERVRACIRRQEWLVDEAIAKRAEERLRNGEGPLLGGAEPDVVDVCRTVLEARDNLRAEVRRDCGSPYRDEEFFMVQARRHVQGHRDLEPRHGEWGFVAYRLCYSHSDAEWDNFVRLFKADVGAWASAWPRERLLPNAFAIHWIDGRDNGMREGDLDGARSHYNSSSQRACRQGLRANRLFLVADQASIDSYLRPSSALLAPGDSDGFITVAAQHYEYADAHNPEAPLFPGTVRVLGALLVEELWGLTYAGAVPLHALWPAAAAHPLRIYTGAAPSSRVATWREMARLVCAFVEGVTRLSLESTGTDA